jgi:hypothetical protein
MNEVVAFWCAVTLILCTLICSITFYNLKSLETDKEFARLGYVQKTSMSGIVWTKP